MGTEPTIASRLRTRTGDGASLRERRLRSGRSGVFVLLALGLACLFARPLTASRPARAATPAGSPPSSASAKSWRIEANLSEACTCSVPFPCNFGGAPSPHHFCYAIFSLDIRKGL